MTTPSETNRKYYIRTSLSMMGYFFVLLAYGTGAINDLKPHAGWVFALVATAPVAVHLWAVIVWMRDSDEFARALAAKRFILGTGITLGLVTAWGFLELYANVPHFPIILILPVFWIAWASVSPFIRTSH